MLKHDRAVAELLHEAVLALDCSIGDFSNLLAIETVPRMASTSVGKVDDVERILEVDEGVTNVTVISEVDAQVHEVVLGKASFINNILKHDLLRVSIPR